MLTIRDKTTADRRAANTFNTVSPAGMLLMIKYLAKEYNKLGVKPRNVDTKKLLGMSIEYAEFMKSCNVDGAETATAAK
jgi:hypothetical protein